MMGYVICSDDYPVAIAFNKQKAEKFRDELEKEDRNTDAPLWYSYFDIKEIIVIE